MKLDHEPVAALLFRHTALEKKAPTNRRGLQSLAGFITLRPFLSIAAFEDP